MSSKRFLNKKVYTVGASVKNRKIFNQNFNMLRQDLKILHQYKKFVDILRQTLEKFQETFKNPRGNFV